MKPTLRIITAYRPRHRGTSPRRRLRRQSSTPPPASAATGPPASEPAQMSEPDFALVRARAAGGPLDAASYSCECGCLFEASVSTTVTCPNCGGSQAW